MAGQLQLEVVTPERRVLSEAVNSVTVPGRGGEMGILPGHAPLISRLQAAGVLSYTEDGTAFQLHISEGFVEVSEDRVVVLTNVAERPEEIDARRAEDARRRAEEALSKAGTEIDFEKTRAKLLRSIFRLQLAPRERD